ncbi:MAG: hypothetical protein IJ306_06545 [Oscillospiraceae bacterium]|nr:hypothetical protein [Oscillospiraceae bacterium]
MKIKVIDKERNFFIGIPTWLIMNYFSATFAPLFINRKTKKHGFRVTVPMCWKFVRAFNKTKKHFGGSLEFVDVETADGEKIKVIL